MIQEFSRIRIHSSGHTVPGARSPAAYVRFFDEHRKRCLSSGSAAAVKNKLTGQMIQGGPDIVDTIADDYPQGCRRFFANSCTYDIRTRRRIEVGDELIRIRA